mgnify:FL=1
MDRVDKTAFSVIALSEPADDRAHWLALTPAERLQAVEQMRRINYGHDPSQRLQRVLEVAEFKPR